MGNIANLLVCFFFLEKTLEGKHTFSFLYFSPVYHKLVNLLFFNYENFKFIFFQFLQSLHDECTLLRSYVSSCIASTKPLIDFAEFNVHKRL